MKPFDPSAFIDKFVDEARDRLKRISENLLILEKAPEETTAIQEALRQTHTLKGTARMLGFNDISQLAHRMEDLFIAVDEAHRSLDSNAFDVLFEAVDALASRVEQWAQGIKEPMDVTSVCQKLEVLAEFLRPSAPPEEEAKLYEPPSSERLVAPVLEPEAKPPSPEPGAGVRTTFVRPAMPEVKRSLRVSVDKIDRLVNLASEMVIQDLHVSERQEDVRRLASLLAQLQDRVREIRHALKSSGDGFRHQLDETADFLDGISRRMGQFFGDFREDRVRLNLITEELRQNVIDLSMMPLSTVFDAFPRAVRDLARDFNKEVSLSIRGSETELDKKIIEQIGDPLIHLVRNAVDHGIEPPDDRERLGKPRGGQLLISAEQQGNRILISVQDDGCGMDPAELRAAAIRKGLASEADLERLNEQDLLNLIFHPGFSTSKIITDVSGRGVGMDVVKVTVERLQGTVRVHSDLRRGTTIVLELPLSLALLRGLLVESGGELFGLPTATVERILYVQPEQVQTLQEGHALEIAGETVPLVPLGGLLQMPAPEHPPLRWPVVVARAFGRRFGVMVDAVHQEQELVFKELRGRLRDQKLFSGVTILGNGQIVLILETHEIFQLATRFSTVRAPVAAAVAGPEAKPASILVVEDSLIAGELERSIVQAAGYQAEIAHDGVHALEMLLEKKFDLVIADVDMPRMDGFELTSRLRKDERFRNIPVVIVTARESPDDRRRGLEVGADAYILKREFDQSQLLETVQRLIGR